MSRHDFFDNPSVHVGQTEISPGVAVCELFVIEAQKVKDGRVQVMNVDLVD